MLNFLKQVGDYAKRRCKPPATLVRDQSVTFRSHARPITVQYPYDLIPSERFQGRILLELAHFCEVVRVCLINLPVVWIGEF